MVDNAPNPSNPAVKGIGLRRPLRFSSRALPRFVQRHGIATAVATILLIGGGWVLGFPSDVPAARVSMPRPSPAATSKVGVAQTEQRTTTTTTTTTTTPIVPPVVATTPTSVVAVPPATAPAPVTPAVAPAVPVIVAAPSAAAPSVAALVSQVEASGIDPGSNWSWSMGDTAIHCGVIVGDGTGCTYGAGGLEYTVFSGSPTLALVAHELGNAETQNDAVPDLLSQVAAAAGGTTWSPTDGVASCLVAHFMGFQDAVAGPWQCPAALASSVAANIHSSL